MGHQKSRSSCKTSLVFVRIKTLVKKRKTQCVSLRYKKNVYGVVNDKTKKMDTQSIEDMIIGEKRRFKYADFDVDGALNLLEFQVSNSHHH